MHPLVLLFNVLLIAIVLWDAFETLVLPRTVSRRLRLTRIYFHATWSVWSHAATMFFAERRRERFLAIFGPLSLLGLAGVWALGLVVAFAGLQWAAGSNLHPLGAGARFIDDLYMSGTTFFTLGLGRFAAGGAGREISHGGRSGNGIRVPRSGDCVFSGAVSVVLTP